MCRHAAVPMFTEPGPDAPDELRLGYVVRGYGRYVVCPKCNLHGFVRNHGKGVTWITPAKAGWLTRDAKFALAAEWNARVAAATAPTVVGVMPWTDAAEGE